VRERVRVNERERQSLRERDRERNRDIIKGGTERGRGEENERKNSIAERQDIWDFSPGEWCSVTIATTHRGENFCLNG
jgi:hypothetical protein